MRFVMIVLTIFLMGWFKGSPGLPPSTFLGNPNVTVASISKTGIAELGTITDTGGGPAVTASFTGQACPNTSCVDTVAETITFASPHGFVNGDRLLFTTTGVLPSASINLATGFSYVCAVSPTVIKLYIEWDAAASCAGVDIVNLTTTGSGTSTAVSTTMYYNINVPLTVTSGTVGTGALATIVVQKGHVVDAVVTTPGSGYDNTSVVTAASGLINNVTGLSIPVTQTGFALSRTSGNTPAFVQVSANGIGVNGARARGTGVNVISYEDLQYSWNCGNGATENVTDPRTAATMNANTDQTGPEATCVYRSTTGSPFTITLTIKYWNGSSVVTDTLTKQFTVNKFTPTVERWFCPGGTTTLNNGTSAANCWNQTDPTTHLANIVDNGTDTNNSAIHIQPGTGFTLAGGGAAIQNVVHSIQGMRIDTCDGYNADGSCKAWAPFGGGGNPTITMTGGGNAPIQFTNKTGKNQDDIVISNLNVISQNPGNNYGGAVTKDTGTFGVAMITNFWMDGGLCDTSAEVDNNGFLLAANQSGMWNYTITTSAANTGNLQTLEGGAILWGSFVGLTISGGNSIWRAGSHGMYMSFLPVDTSLMNKHILIRWSKAFNGPNKDNAFKFRTDYGVNFIVFDQSFAQNYANGFDPGQDDNSAPPTYSFGLVCSANAFNMNANANAHGCGATARYFSITARYNRSWIGALANTHTMSPDHIAIATSFTQTKTYKNENYMNTGSNPVDYQDITGSCGLVTCGPFTAPQILTDNNFVIAGVGNLITLSLTGAAGTTMQTNGSYIQRNHYWAGSASPFNNAPAGGGGGSVNFATWQGSPYFFDLAGTMNNGSCPSTWVTCTPASWSDFGP